MIDEGTALSVGDAIAAARRQAGLTITQVSQRTCIRETIVRGIERGDYSACGGDFYARGHVRSISRAVGLDPDEMVREYDASQSPPLPITAADVFQPFTPVRLRERRRPNWTLVLLAGLVVVAGIVGFRYFSHSSTPSAGQSASSHHSAHGAKPPVSASPAAASPAATQVEILIVPKPGQVTWAELTAATGKLLFQGDVGTSVGLPQLTSIASDGMTVRLGNPAGANVYLNGKLQPTNVTNPVTLQCSRTICT
ncbi:MAG: helix-turn-helix domain-containing protein [Streptosporangiaceae bacterium]